jgi:hypothetical protein
MNTAAVVVLFSKLDRKIHKIIIDGNSFLLLLVSSDFINKYTYGTDGIIINFNDNTIISYEIS